MRRNKRILIVDDEPFNILGLQIVLQQSGVKHILDFVDKAVNGKVAVNMVKKAYNDKQFSYGLIFMDCSMPIMNGYEATDSIRSFIKSKNML